MRIRLLTVPHFCLLLLFIAFGLCDDIVCNDDDGVTFEDDLGYNYTVLCSYGYNSIDGSFTILYQTQPDPGISACAKICSEWSNGRPDLPCTYFYTGDGDCTIMSGSPKVITGGPYNFARLEAKPASTPRPVSFNASCDADNFKQYIDSQGTIYFTMCSKTSSSETLTDSKPFSPHTFEGCIQACSDNNLIGDNVACIGAFFDPINLICGFDPGNLQTVIDAQYDSAYVLGSTGPCNLSTSTAENYTTPEGDAFYIGFRSALEGTDVLANSTQSSSCGCAEQCSLYNIAYGNISLPCAGAQFDPDPQASPNCLVKSN